ncbi:hypothetical protein ANN_26555 [Periplaneta americana]|uniref:Uncharacterized protein n=1 Tax=Periplaneta americana TaxID=6978 RepID=A0ABQ8RZ38_PERAM|nr:hypothetical protein ANN_26555 [Periplaneta americana]
MDAVLPALKTISLWTDKDVSSKADMLHSSVTKPAFLISLHVINKLFCVTNTLSEYLQKTDMNLEKALKHVENVLEVLQQVSDAAEDQFKSIFSTVSAQLMSLGEEIRIPRCACGQRSQFRSNVPADNAEEYYRRTVFLPFLSNMQSQIKTRFAEHNNILTKFLCLIKEDGVASDFIVLAKFYSQVDTNFCVQDEELSIKLLLFIIIHLPGLALWMFQYVLEIIHLLNAPSTVFSIHIHQIECQEEMLILLEEINVSNNERCLSRRIANRSQFIAPDKKSQSRHHTAEDIAHERHQDEQRRLASDLPTACEQLPQSV